jgi:hypothetical protein
VHGGRFFSPLLEFIMDNDVFGRVCFFTFVDVPAVDSIRDRCKRVKLATIYCKRSDAQENFATFKSANKGIASRIVAEFSFEETL